jgi:hypothetical protein
MKIEVYAKISRLNNPLKIGKHPFWEYFKLPIEDRCVSFDESEFENIKKAFNSHLLFFNELPLVFGCFLTKKLSFNDFMKGMKEKSTQDGINTYYQYSHEGNNVFIKDFNKIFSKNVQDFLKPKNQKNTYLDYQLDYELKQSDENKIKTIDHKKLVLKIPYISIDNESKLLAQIIEQILYNLLFVWEGSSIYHQLFNDDLGRGEAMEWDSLKTPLRYKDAKLPKGYLGALKVVDLLEKLISEAEKREEDVSDLENSRQSVYDFISNNYGTLISYCLPYFNTKEYLRFFYAFSMRTS